MTDETNTGDDRWCYAPAKTLRGALQRGSAWHQVVPGLVLDCVRRDYRWDRQVDERTVYLVRLARGFARGGAKARTPTNGQAMWKRY
ncbi:hypothetical protein [Amycolatopsis sp. H20-H5]|uniref:hypothetical protein n=1 Tax=Amycolatopsis sp. H20-H5 TaxID=3046309 RepID=UPI002DC040EB|nr:hypothetical protein [Amycolatopsis sp. H20-H5]MEC3980825.1 hypothetical protein [Amycolatopsis sp. H20-H5]